MRYNVSAGSWSWPTKPRWSTAVDRPTQGIQDDGMYNRSLVADEFTKYTLFL